MNKSEIGANTFNNVLTESKLSIGFPKYSCTIFFKISIGWKKMSLSTTPKSNSCEINEPLYLSISTAGKFDWYFPSMTFASLQCRLQNFGLLVYRIKTCCRTFIFKGENLFKMLKHVIIPIRQRERPNFSK